MAVEYLVPPTRGGLKIAGKLLTQQGRKVLTRAVRKEVKAMARDARTVLAGAKLGAPKAKQLAKNVLKNPKAAAKKAVEGAKTGAKKAAGNVKAGTQKALKGAKAGAANATSKVKGNLSKRTECAKRAFHETKGTKRYWEATKRFFSKDPIDVVTGALFDQRIDIVLGQTIPLTFIRSWAPEERGLLGQNWTDSFSGFAIVIGDRVEIRTTEGASLYFILTRTDRSSMNPEHPNFTLERSEMGYVLHERDNPVSQHFSVAVPTDDGGQQWQLGALCDRHSNAINFHYSEQHQLVRITHSDGPELVLLYRGDGLLEGIRRTDNDLNEVMAHYGYHDNGWLADADSRQHFHLFYEYNAQGLISRWHDGDQTAVDYRYDEQGRCIYTVGSGGYYPGVFEYEPGITRVINPEGHITTWHHNDQQLVTQEETPCGNITRYEYDAAGRMTAMHTPEGTTTYRYDMIGRLLEVASPDTLPLTFEYDGQDRIVKENQPYGDISRAYPDSFTADRQILTPDGRRWQTKTGVNNVGELTLLAINGEHTLRLEHDEEGQEWHRQSDQGFILRQEHSLMGQLTAQRAGRNTEIFEAHEVADIPQPTLAGLDREYRYDTALNLVAANDDSQWLNYVVNGNGQVTSVSDRDRLQEHYQYDASGYPFRRFDGVQEVDGEWLYQKGHRLRRLGQHLFEYDDAGRMTAIQLWEEGHRAQLTKFRWNSQSQLVGLLTPDGQQWEYRYDPFGRRTEKVCDQAGMRTTYVWDGDVPAEIREYRHHRLYSIRHLVFDGWQLLAQQVQFFTPNPENRSDLQAGELQTQYAVCAPTGEPLALFDPKGHRVWRQPAHSLYGLRLSTCS
ncbi:DUF6531 domain-containing protein [Xenorhabdus bovienii]|uniref:DUF6531 domain-containing protein n=1 Tax=Xenorhabdus bovienii TaxID=40576 RepID=UPI001E635239|nr:DUF6531 domain-containing protein [Xenorhabdus bovienii]